MLAFLELDGLLQGLKGLLLRLIDRGKVLDGGLQLLLLAGQPGHLGLPRPVKLCQPLDLILQPADGGSLLRPAAQLLALLCKTRWVSRGRLTSQKSKKAGQTVDLLLAVAKASWSRWISPAAVRSLY